MTTTPDQRASIAKVQSVFAAFNNSVKARSGPVCVLEPSNLLRQAYEGNQQFDADLMRRVRIIDATSAGTAVLELDVGEEYSNSGGSMHGGAVALILGTPWARTASLILSADGDADQFTTTAFIPITRTEVERKDGYHPPGGFTRAMNVTCLRPLPLPATIRVVSEVVQNGRFTSLVRGKITDRGGGRVYFVCEHHKVRLSGTAKAADDGTVKKGKL